MTLPIHHPLSHNCHPERSMNVRSANAYAKSKDLLCTAKNSLVKLPIYKS